MELDEFREKLNNVYEKNIINPLDTHFHSTWHQAPIGQSHMCFTEYDGSVRQSVDGPGQRHVFRVAFNRAGSLRLRINGVETLQTATAAAIHAPGQSLEFVSTPFACLMMFIDGDRGERAMQRRFGRTPPLETWATGFSLETPAGQAWQSLMLWTAQELDRPGTILLSSRKAAEGVERALLTLFLECLADRLPVARARAEDLCEKQVRMIEAWIDANLGEPIGVEELAAVIGSNSRAVQAAFRRLRGCSPLQAVAGRRLQAARHALLAPDAATTVTGVALDCGFFHLGRFSQRYRLVLGERPSETLLRGRRAAGLGGLVIDELGIA
jgi:AraC-like DNA-binding protein